MVRPTQILRSPGFILDVNRPKKRSTGNSEPAIITHWWSTCSHSGAYRVSGGLVRCAGAGRDECRRHGREVAQRTSARGPVTTATAALCRRLTHALLPSEHVARLLAMTDQACLLPCTSPAPTLRACTEPHLWRGNDAFITLRMMLSCEWFANCCCCCQSVMTPSRTIQATH